MHDRSWDELGAAQGRQLWCLDELDAQTRSRGAAAMVAATRWCGRSGGDGMLGQRF
jgi:hypothetical protein